MNYTEYSAAFKSYKLKLKVSVLVVFFIIQSEIKHLDIKLERINRRTL